jgi:hypothetical protein
MTQVGGIVVLVCVAVSLLFSVMAWQSSGVIAWRNLVGSAGVGLLGLALTVGPRRKVV